VARPVPKLFAAEPPENCSGVYRNVLAAPNHRAALAREHCEVMWQEFYDLADENFLDRFPFEFHQRWFEMYLGSSLRQAGLNVSAPKPGPDFGVSLKGRPIFIEAVAPTRGHPLHADAVHDPVYTDADGNPLASQVPHAQVTLRLADAFRRKADVFDGYRAKGYVGKDDPCIIAINLADVPHAWADADEFWFRALYGVGDRFVQIDRSGEATMSGRHHRSLLNRAGGAVEDVAPLLNPDHARICGVLGSAADVANVPNPPGDDFLLMPHAVALSPFPPGFIGRGVELLLNPTDKGDQWNIETIDYGAHKAQGPKAFEIEFDGKTVKGEWAVEGRILSVRVEDQRCDVPVAGGADAAESAMRIGFEILRARES
jgi:hypothetical protein